MIDLFCGRRFGQLVVLSCGVNRSDRLVARCDCGRTCTPLTQNVLRGRTRSCGCGMRVGGGRKQLDMSSAVRLYESGLSIGDVAACYGVSRQSMWDSLNRRGVKFRAQKRFSRDNTFHRGGSVVGKIRARGLVQRATESGKILRATVCEKCGRGGKIEGHHDDYNKPFALRWLCKKCHFEWHRFNEAVALRT